MTKVSKFKTVKIQADKERKLKLGTLAIAEFENESGISIAELADNKSFKNIILLFKAALMHEQYDLTYPEACDIADEVIAEEGMEYLVEKLTEAMEGLSQAKTPSAKG